MAGRGEAETPPTQAERRPLSMMFVDLVGSARLAEMLSTEDLMELLRRYGDFCAGPIGRYGGRVTRMVGDGILAFFCYPLANENDPERAVRAALDIVQGLGELAVPGGERLAVRIGIATGRVVVGDLVTAGGVHRDTVVGTAPNLAARLQTLAPVGGIVVSEDTFLRVRDKFVCADMGSFELRGMAQPHRCWQVLREMAAYGRVPRRRLALIGRDADMAALNAAWARTLEGHGGTVALLGEPGIGKSHLTEAFLAAATPASAATVLLEGAALEQDSPLRPVVAWLHRAAGASSVDERVGARLAKVLPGWASVTTRLAPLLGEAALPAAAEEPPEQVREATLAALEKLLLAQAEARPLRLVAEDLHWFDPTTLELIGRLTRRAPQHRLLLLLTAREEPDLDVALGGAQAADGVQRRFLSRLGEAEVASLAAQMLPGQALPDAWLRTIRRKADGVPLFVSEIVRELAARGEAELPDDRLAESIIPASIHELLAGRLDRLGEAKEIAQAAAVLGPDLRPDLLARVCAAQFGTGPVALDSALTTLSQAGVLIEGDGRRATGFVHALLQDAAYQSLLRDPRQALHGHVARALLACDPDAAGRRPELIAQHLQMAALPSEAVPYWMQAGRSSLAASALGEAIHHLERALLNLDAVPPTPETMEHKLEVMALLGPALMAARGAGSPEAAQLYAAANALCEQMPQSARNFPIYWGWWRVTQDIATRRDRALTLLARARNRRDPELLLQAYHCSWASDFFVGSYGQSCEHARAGLSIYDEHDFRHHVHIYGGHDAKVCAHGELALCHWIMGRTLTARLEEQRSWDWAERLGHLGSRLHNRENRLFHHAWRADLRKSTVEARALLDVASEHDLEDLRAKAMIFLGHALSGGSEPQDGRAMLEEGWRRQNDIGTNEDYPVYVTLLAQALVSGGEPERALAVLNEAEAAFDQSGLWFWRSEVRRMQAEAVLAASGTTGAGHDRAVHLFDAAFDIAQQQGAAMLALRAATGLARIEPGAAGIARLRRALQAVPEDDRGADLLAAEAVLAAVPGRSLDALS
jgi:class 3 adenylate cyclase